MSTFSPLASNLNAYFVGPASSLPKRTLTIVFLAARFLVFRTALERFFIWGVFGRAGTDTKVIGIPSLELQGLEPQGFALA